MPIDHFASDVSKGGTFKNRYWLNATYYEAGGPVFRTSHPSQLAECGSDGFLFAVFDSGEQNAEPLLPYYLQVRRRFEAKTLDGALNTPL